MSEGPARATARDTMTDGSAGPPASLPTTAMVLAAGLGERMMPLTQDRPKPLIDIAGRTLIDRILDHLSMAGVPLAVVNLHYLGEMLEAHLRVRAGGPKIVFSDERDARLETGGGIKHALPLFDCDPILAINSDGVWTDGPRPAIHRLAEAWDGARMDILLLVVPRGKAVGYSGDGDFEMDGDGALRFPEKPGPAPFVYAGLQMLSLAPVANAPERIFSLSKLYREAAGKGRLFGVVHDGGWAHVGSPEAIGPAASLLGGGRGEMG